VSPWASVIRYLTPKHQQPSRSGRRKPKARLTGSVLSRSLPWTAAYRPFQLRRKLNEVTVTLNTNTIPVVAATIPTGASGSTPYLFGTPISEASGYTYSIPFSTRISLDCAVNAGSDIQQFWREYRIGGVKTEILLLNGDSYYPGAQVSAVLPEIATYLDPYDAVPPGSVSDVDVRGDSRWRLLGGGRALTFNYIPKPTAQYWDTATATAYPIFNRDDYWCNTKDSTMQHFGLKGIIRNFPSLSTGVASLKVVFRTTAVFTLRTPGINTNGTSLSTSTSSASSSADSSSFPAALASFSLQLANNKLGP
jgi:hypothetical protein